jgi:hypothetical protein
MELSINASRLLSSPPPSRRRLTPLARKRRHARLVRELVAELGLDQPTLAQVGLLATTVTLLLRTEQLRDAVVRGELVDNGELIRLSSETRRVTRLLGLDGKPEPPRPLSIAEYLSRESADDGEADDGDEASDAEEEAT